MNVRALFLLSLLALAGLAGCLPEMKTVDGRLPARTTTIPCETEELAVDILQGKQPKSASRWVIPLAKAWSFGWKRAEPPAVGRYTMSFRRPRHWWFRRTILHFDGVSSAFRVRVNGKDAGSSAAALQPVEFDLSPALKWFGANTLEVEVDDPLRPLDVFRDCYLVSERGDAPFDIVAETQLADDLKSGKFIIRDEKGNVLKERDVPTVNLWTPEIPFVYMTPLENKWGWWIFGGTDYRALQFGFRKVEVKDGALILNGRRLPCCGVERPAFDPTAGFATTATDATKEVLALKERNVNVIRLSGFTAAPEWYDACDREGLMVCCSNAAVTLERDPPAVGAFRRNARPALRNHPSVIDLTLADVKDGFRPEPYGKAYSRAAWEEVTRAYQPIAFEAFDFETGKVRLRNDLAFTEMEDHYCTWEALHADGTLASRGVFDMGGLKPGLSGDFQLQKFKGDKIDFKFWLDQAVVGWAHAELPVLTLTAENTDVVIAKDAPKPVRFAAEELTNYLAQVLGGPVKIVDAAVTLERDPPVVGAFRRNARPVDAKSVRVQIVLGTNSLSSAAGVHPEKLPRDSFIVKVTSQTSPCIFIAGCDDPSWDVRKAWKRGNNGETQTPYERGTLYGVYDFLERHAGLRFYFPGPLGTIVPKRTALRVPVRTVSESPDFIKRVWYSPGGELMDGQDLGVGWKPSDRSQVGFIQFMRARRFSGTPLVHGMRHMSLRERFGKTHPEYFWASRDKDGKLVRHSDPKDGEYVHICWSSGVLDEIYADWVAYAKGETPESRGITCDRSGGKGVWPRLAYGPGIVSLDPDDGFCGCECDQCRAFYPNGELKGSYASELVWSKTAELANRLKKDGIPLLVAQASYTCFADRPKNVRLPDNVVVGVCQMGPWAEGAPSRRDADLAEVKAWSELAGGAKLFLHNWSLKYGALNIPDIPCWSPRAFGTYYERVAPYAKGVYNESHSDRLAHTFLNNYILGKMTWNTKFDYNAAIDEHFRLMYGPAAGEMTQFFNDLEDCWVNRVAAGKVTYNELGPVYTIPTPFEMWRNIYTGEKVKEWADLFAKAEKKVEGLPARRLALMKRNVFDPLVAARTAFAEATDAAREEERRKREGVKNLLDREYAAEFSRAADNPEKDHECATTQNNLLVPYTVESNATYRLSFFLDADEVVRTAGGYRFNGALVGLWTHAGWLHPSKTGATIGSTFGRVHQSIVFKGSVCFRPDEEPNAPHCHNISIWLRGATGKMKVDGLILEKVGND